VENCGKDAPEALTALYAAQESNPRVGFNVDTGTPMDALEAGVVDLLPTKANALRLAVDAALTVLRVDQVRMPYNSYIRQNVDENFQDRHGKARWRTKATQSCRPRR
jgi:chaperonin GroEL (HSP60 family)